MMKFATRLKVTANVAGGVISTLTLGAAALGCRTLQQAIDAGNAASDATAIKVSDTGVPFVVENATTGDWEEAYYTITSGAVITKGAIIASSNAGAAVNFPAGTVNVFNAPPGGWLRKIITTDDGVSLSTLPTLNPASLPSATLLADFLIGPVIDPATGINYNIKLGNLPGSSAAPALQITVNTISTQVAGTPFSVSGTYANGTPSGLEFSINGGLTYGAPSSASIGGGTFTIGGVSIPNANNSQTVLVRDTTTKIAGASAAFLVNAAPYITTNTPNSQVVNVAFPVTGWYYNYTPTAFDYRFSDDTAGVWTQATSSVSITGGAFSFNVTCTTTNASRTVTVRDRTTQTIVGTSGAFSVAAGAATVSGVAVLPSPATVIGGKTQQFTATVSGTNNPSQSVTWSLVSGVGSIDANGLYTAPAATTAAQSAVIKAISQQDGSTASPNVTITIPAQTITVTTPATQTVGTAYTLAGTWTGLQPTALQYQYADNGGTATAWAALTGATINANGTWSASITPTAASTSRVMSVRDSTTLIQGSSAAYVVNAAAVLMKDQYQLTSSNSATASFTAATLSNSTGTGTASVTVRVNIRSAQTTSATYPANADAKFVWGKADTSNIANSVCPANFADNYVKAGSVNGNTADGNTTTIGTLQHLASWSDSSSGYFGTFTTVAAMNAIGTPGTYVLWVMLSDGSKKMYDNNQGQSNPLTWVLS